MRLGVFSALALLIVGCVSLPAQSSTRTPLGFWVRLTFDEDTDARMWDQLEEAGATDLFVETFYHGFVIYPESNLFVQRPGLEETDPLRWAIDEAHARDIRLHAWIHCLRWGVDEEAHPEIPRSPLIDWVRGTDLLAHTVDGGSADDVFVSPSHSEVRDLATRLCLDIAHRYRDIDGINLDDIRWPAASEASAECWYDFVNVTSFRESAQRDLLTDDSEETMTMFRDHSAMWVTELVRTISTAIHGLFPSVTLSAAFFPDRDQADAWPKAQDWRTWLEEGLIDVATPMCYSNALDGVVADVENVAEVAAEHRIPLWAGLAVKADTDHAPAVEQLEAIQGRGAEGAVIFSHGWVAEQPEEFTEIGEWLTENEL